MKRLYLLFIVLYASVFGIWDVRVAYNLWDDDGDDRRLLQLGMLCSSERYIWRRWMDRDQKG